MKASRILLFILSVILILGLTWAVFPQGGIEVGGTTLRFASYEEASSSINEEAVDVDKVLSEVEQSFRLSSGSQQDTLRFLRISSSPIPTAFGFQTMTTPIWTLCFISLNAHRKRIKPIA